jgi:hypothetical protein
MLNIIASWIGPWAVASQVMPIMFANAFWAILKGLNYARNGVNTLLTTIE